MPPLIPNRRFMDALNKWALDSEVMYHKLIKKLCEKYQKTYSDALQARMYGGTDKEICKTVVRELKLPVCEYKFEKQLHELSEMILPCAPLQKGVVRLLTHFFNRKVPMALATNSTEQAVRAHIKARPKLFAMFHHKVTATDPAVCHGKPKPDLYLIAAERFPDKPKPSKCLVFEDSATGVTAAKAAGMQVVMIPNPRLGPEQTREATLVVRSLFEFKPELFGLPPFVKFPKPCKICHCNKKNQ